MNQEKRNERARYLATIFWMNTFGLIFEIIDSIRKNRKITNPVAREANGEALEEDIIRLIRFVAICLLIVAGWLFLKGFLSYCCG